MSMDLFDQGAHQRLPIQFHVVFSFYLGDDVGDMQRILGAPEYVHAHVNIRHTLNAFGVYSFRPGGFKLAKGSQLGAEHTLVKG
jgi:hypothetical protein